MKAYAVYKTWWLSCQTRFNADDGSDVLSDSEQFARHINEMTQFEMMEIMESWADD